MLSGARVGETGTLFMLSLIGDFRAAAETCKLLWGLGDSSTEFSSVMW